MPMQTMKIIFFLLIFSLLSSNVIYAKEQSYEDRSKLESALYSDGSFFNKTEGFLLQNSPKIKILDEAPGKLKYFVYRPTSHSYETTSMEVFFDPMTYGQFNYLIEKFGFGKSQLQYSRTEEYRLIDFFPPALQAAYQVSRWTHCYGFIAQYLGSTSNKMDARVTSKTHDLLLDRLENPAFYKKLRKGEALLPGDIILDPYPPGEDTIPTSHDFVVIHIFIYLDDNFSIGANPYRFQINGGIQGEFLSKDRVFNGIHTMDDFKEGERSRHFAYRAIQVDPAPIKSSPHINRNPFQCTISYKTDDLGRAYISNMSDKLRKDCRSHYDAITP